MTDNNATNFTRINQQIRVPRVRLILEDGSSPGVVNTYEALAKAKELGLDAIEINPKSSPPVVRLGNWGKMQYEQSKKAKEQRKQQKSNEVKEIAFRPTTENHDLEHKLAKAKEFLLDGCRVRLCVKFRGREITHSDLGKAKLEAVLASLADLTASYTPFSAEGKSIATIVSPKTSNQ